MTIPPNTHTNPVLAHTIRGDLMENRYRGAYVVVDKDGDVIAAGGNFRQIIYARSSLKPINVLAMLESGAADEYGVTEEEIALAIASHNGEDQHVTMVQAWLDRLGLTYTDLECGAHAPMGREAAKSLAEQGEKPTTLHNACSGKHTGFLTLCRFLGDPPKGYTDESSRTQQAIMATAAKVLGIQVQGSPRGIDGCRIPMMGMEMISLAHGMVNLVAPQKFDHALHRACDQVISAMQNHPFLLAGTGRFDTDIIEKTKGQVLVKMGADGVFSGIIPKKKWGIAMKIDDGNLKAAEVAMAGLLNSLKLLDNPDDFAQWIHPPIRNWNKETVGKMEPAL